MGWLPGFLAKRPHLFLLLLYPLVGMGFAYCEAVVTVPTFIVEWPGVDRAIPFIPWMIGPYLFWYLAVAFAFLWLGFRDGREFKRLAWYVYGGMTSTYVLYLLLPNGETLRPALEGMTGWDVEAVRWVYAHDTPQNVCPSLHIVDTMAVWFSLIRDRTLTAHAWFRPLLVAVCLAIIVSTVTVKQHSVIDVAAGLAWSGLWYGLIYSKRSPFFGGDRLR